MAPANPFFHRGPIRDRSYFFGRGRLTARALAFLAQGQSVAVVGPRRIGKTSLLFHLMDPAVQAGRQGPAPPLRCCYIDCEGLGQVSADQLYGRLTRAVGRSLAPTDGAHGGAGERGELAALEQLVRQAAAAGDQLVLLLDEFETLAANPHLDNDFFGGLRALAMEHRLAYVTVSSRPLLELTYARVLTRSSPFFNFFALLPIGLFTRPESIAMLQDLSARGGAPFTPAFCEQLIAVTGDHPFFLQIIADAAFEQVAAGEPQTPALAARLLAGPFGAEATDHWAASWAQLTAEDRRLLALLPVLAPGQPAAVRRLEAAGLVARASDGSPALSGGGWQAFVSAQPVEGLAQAEPVTLDPALRVALLRGRPLALAPQPFDLLAYLVARRERIVTREELCLAIWQRDEPSSHESLRTALKTLREALGPDEACVQTIRGQGYQFVGAKGASVAPPSPDDTT